MTLQTEGPVREYAAEAARGADRIEEVFPGSLAQVNLDILTMHSYSLCVLGQCAADMDLSYFDALDALRVDYSNEHAYGFSLPPTEHGGRAAWEALRAAWVDEIKNRT